MATLRDMILASNDITLTPCEVPEWKTPEGTPVTVYIKTPSVGIQEKIADCSGKPSFGANLVILVTCDEAGARLFTTNDIPALNEKSGAAVSRIVDVFNKLSGYGNEAKDEAKKN